MIRNLIYALESPDDGKVYYIGMSEHGLERPYAHLSKSHNTEVKDWLANLNTEPVVRILERNLDNVDLLRTREQYWIRTMLDRKEPLFNKAIPTEKQLRYHDYQVGKFVRERRKLIGLTQKEFAFKSGLGLRFVRDLEQGKESCRMDKVLQALYMFGATLVPVVKH